MSVSATPAMRQYLEAKQQNRDAILFFRMGDFYEMFYEDALVAARALELTLTSRSRDANGGGIPMCGVPYHAADSYIARLVKRGFRVAICDQVEDPRTAKGIVKREVVRVVSPGTFTDVAYLDAREPAFLMALAPSVARDGQFSVVGGHFSTCRPESSPRPSIAAPTDCRRFRTRSPC
jgi:DNA mismatch repair protein MutS